MAYTLAGITLHVKSENVNIEPNLEVQTMPASGSDSTITYDINGTSRDFTLDGIITATDLAGMQTGIAEITALINGSQSNMIFASETAGSVTVKIAKFNYTRSVTDTGLFAVSYVIQLQETQ